MLILAKRFYKLLNPDSLATKTECICMGNQIWLPSMYSCLKNTSTIWNIIIYMQNDPIVKHLIPIAYTQSGNSHEQQVLHCNCWFHLNFSTWHLWIMHFTISSDSMIQHKCTCGRWPLYSSFPFGTFGTALGVLGPELSPSGILGLSCGCGWEKQANKNIKSYEVDQNERM